MAHVLIHEEERAFSKESGWYYLLCMLYLPHTLPLHRTKWIHPVFSSNQQRETKAPKWGTALDGLFLPLNVWRSDAQYHLDLPDRNNSVNWNFSSFPPLFKHLLQAPLLLDAVSRLIYNPKRKKKEQVRTLLKSKFQSHPSPTGWALVSCWFHSRLFPFISLLLQYLRFWTRYIRRTGGLIPSDCVSEQFHIAPSDLTYTTSAVGLRYISFHWWVAVPEVPYPWHRVVGYAISRSPDRDNLRTAW